MKVFLAFFFNILLLGFIASCSDDNNMFKTCTTSSDCPSGKKCVFGKCIEPPGLTCNTKDDCAFGFTCVNNRCVAQSYCNTDSDCKDGMKCINGVCDIPAQQTKCSSNSDCKEGETCDTQSGVCIKESCTSNDECDDGDPCTENLCVDGKCQFEKSTKLCCEFNDDCKDANPCTKDFCNNGKCYHDPIEGCCASDSDCNDNNSCTIDVCIANQCFHPVKTDSENCKCTSTADCDDGNPCTTDLCLNLACQYEKNTNSPIADCCLEDSSCDDGNDATEDYCTEYFYCNHVEKFKCNSDSDCDDNNPCTVDRCESGYCNNTDLGDSCCFQDSDCDDKNPKTVDKCVNNQCVNELGCTKDSDCDDSNPCTNDSCVNEKCVNEKIENCCINDSDCDDGNEGTIDTCENNVCKHIEKGKCETQSDCDDNYICSSDICDDDGFCTYKPSYLPECNCEVDSDCNGVIAPQGFINVCTIFLNESKDQIVHSCWVSKGGKNGGEACESDSECKTGLCIEFKKGKLCYGACKSDSDCYGDSICGTVHFADENNPSNELSIDACVFKPTPCTNDLQCDTDEVCYPVESLEVKNTIQPVCVPAKGKKGAGALCNDDSECKSNYCFDAGNNQKRCLGVCHDSSDCADGGKCYDDLFFLIFDQGTDTTTDDVYQSFPCCFSDLGSYTPCSSDSDCPYGEFCYPFTNKDMTQFVTRCRYQTGTKIGGESCTTDSECKSNVCVGKDQGNGFCFGVCSSNYDCATNATCQSVDIVVNDKNTPNDESDDLKAPLNVCVPSF